MTSKSLIEHPRPGYAWTIFFLSIIFNAYAITLQFSPTLRNILVENSSKVTSTVYALTGFYYTYAICQIPVGILIDRYGSRIFPSIGVFLCAGGSLLMSTATSNLTIVISRAIIGMGAAFSFLNGLKLINNWFQPKKFSYLLGLFVAISSFLVVILKLVFKYLVDTQNWQSAMLVFGLGGLIFACFFFFFVQDAPGAGFYLHSPVKDKDEFWKNIKNVFNSSQVWVIGIAVGLVIGPLFAFQTIWAIPFVKLAYNATNAIAIMFNILFIFGYAIGAVFFGMVSTSIGKRKMFVVWGTFIALLMLLIILYPPYLGIQVTSICFFILGFGASNINIGYTTVHEHNIPQVTATSIAVVSTFYAFFAAITQSLIAVFLELGSKIHGASEYTTGDYQVSLIRLPVYIGIAVVFSFFIKETYAKQRQTYSSD
jgi:MFS family permease